jgi:hypothetical protein
MQLPPGSAAGRAVLFNQPFARSAELQAGAVHHHDGHGFGEFGEFTSFKTAYGQLPTENTVRYANGYRMIGIP